MSTLSPGGDKLPGKLMSDSKITPEMIALVRRPLDRALAAAEIDYPLEVAELRAEIAVRPGPNPAYVGWLSQHHPVLTYWCSSAAALEQRLGRRRYPGQFTPRPLLDALETLYVGKANIEQIRLPHAPLEWREVEAQLTDAHYRRMTIRAIT